MRRGKGYEAHCGYAGILCVRCSRWREYNLPQRAAEHRVWGARSSRARLAIAFAIATDPSLTERLEEAGRKGRVEVNCAHQQFLESDTLERH